MPCGMGVTAVLLTPDELIIVLRNIHCSRNAFRYPCIQLSKIESPAPRGQRCWCSFQRSVGFGWKPALSGGDDRDRTDDLWLAKPALSQLSYIPAYFYALALAARRGGAAKLNGGPE